jgi:hypothetical protein
MRKAVWLPYRRHVLSERQLREFGDQGYPVLPGVVPERLLASVDAEIDALVAERPPPAGGTGNHFYSEPPGWLPRIGCRPP